MKSENSIIQINENGDVFLHGRLSALRVTTLGDSPLGIYREHWALKDLDRFTNEQLLELNEFDHNIEDYECLVPDVSAWTLDTIKTTLRLLLR